MMRVLRLCSVFESPTGSLVGRGVRFDPIGGMQNHTAQLSRVLDDLGMRQTVVTTRPPLTPAVSRLGRHGLVIRLGLPLPACRQFYALLAWPRVVALARGADLVHAHLGEDLAIMPLAVHAATGAGVPLVVTVHCSPRRTLRTYGPRSVVLKIVGGALERYGLDRAAAVITLTERLCRELPGANVHVIPSGIGADVTTAAPGRQVLPAGIPRPRIGYVGRLHPQKGLDTLLGALALLEPAAGAHLVIVGDGPERSRLGRLAARLRIADRTHFVGFVPHADVSAVLRELDVFALPSRYEELGSVLLEAMYCRVPVVASRVGGIPELVEHRRTGLFVPPRSPALLAAAIGELLTDAALRQALADAAYRHAAACTWDRLAPRVLSVYRSVLAAEAAAPTPSILR